MGALDGGIMSTTGLWVVAVCFLAWAVWLVAVVARGYRHDEPRECSQLDPCPECGGES